MLLWWLRDGMLALYVGDQNLIPGRVLPNTINMVLTALQQRKQKSYWKISRIRILYPVAEFWILNNGIMSKFGSKIYSGFYGVLTKQNTLNRETLFEIQDFHTLGNKFIFVLICKQSAVRKYIIHCWILNFQPILKFWANEVSGYTVRRLDNSCGKILTKFHDKHSIP